MKDNSWLVLYLSTKRIYDLLPYYEIGFQYKWLIPCIYIGFVSRTRNTLGSQSAYTLVVVLAKGKPKLQSKRRDVIFVDELPFVEGKINEPQFKPTYLQQCFCICSLNRAMLFLILLLPMVRYL
jgi:hypothetical protein